MIIQDQTGQLIIPITNTPPAEPVTTRKALCKAIIVAIQPTSNLTSSALQNAKKENKTGATGTWKSFN